MIDDKIEIAKLFNKYFVNIKKKKLELFTKEQTEISTENSLSEVEIAIVKYGNHPSIIAMRKWKNLVTLPLASSSLRMRKQ